MNVLTDKNSKGVAQLDKTDANTASALDGAPGLKTGNIAPKDYFADGDGYRAVNTMQPAYQPSGNFPAMGASGDDLAYADPTAATTLPPQTQTTVGDLLTAKNIDWAWYATSWDKATTDGMQPAGSTHAVIYAPSGPRATHVGTEESLCDPLGAPKNAMTLATPLRCTSARALARARAVARAFS